MSCILRSKCFARKSHPQNEVFLNAVLRGSNASLDQAGWVVDANDERPQHNGKNTEVTTPAECESWCKAEGEFTACEFQKPLPSCTDCGPTVCRRYTEPVSRCALEASGINNRVRRFDTALCKLASTPGTTTPATTTATTTAPATTTTTTTAPPVDCQVGMWQTESACSANCGPGTKNQRRSIVKPAANGGAACPSLTQAGYCNHGGCPVNCQVGSWTNKGSCLKECGAGKQEQQRAINTAAAHGGAACPSLTQKAPCNTQPCPTFEYNAQGTECKGDEKDLGYVENQFQCAEKSQDVGSRWFIYGRDSTRCKRKYGFGLYGHCKCYAEVPGKKECQKTSHSSYDLYKNLQRKTGR